MQDTKKLADKLNAIIDAVNASATPTIAKEDKE